MKLSKISRITLIAIVFTSWIIVPNVISARPPFKMKRVKNQYFITFRANPHKQTIYIHYENLSPETQYARATLMWGEDTKPMPILIGKVSAGGSVDRVVNNVLRGTITEFLVEHGIDEEWVEIFRDIIVTP